MFFDQISEAVGSTTGGDTFTASAPGFLLKDRRRRCIHASMRSRWFFMLTLVAGITFDTADSRADSEVGYLFVESTPKHARVVIDGDDKLIVLAPLLCTLSVGPHKLTVYSEEHLPSTVGVYITAGKILRKKIRFVGPQEIEQSSEDGSDMFAVNGNLSIVTDIFGGVIFLDSIRMNITVPATLRSIPAGVHHVRIEHSGLGFDTTVTIHAGVTEMLQLSLLQLWELPPLEEMPPPSALEAAPPPPELVTVVVNMELPGCRYRRDLAFEVGAPFDSAESSPDYPEVGGASDDNMRTLAYHGSRTPVWDDENMSMRGVDAMVSILTEDKIVVISHRFAVDSTMSLRPQLTDLEVGMPVRLARRYTMAPKGSEVSFEIELFVHQSMKFAGFDSLLPIRKQYRLNTDLNGGDDINVHIRVDTEGEVFFRYW